MNLLKFLAATACVAALTAVSTSALAAPAEAGESHMAVESKF